MISKNKTYNDEINLIELFKTIWRGKTKIIIIVIISIFCAIWLNKSQPNPTFESATDIRPLKKSQLGIFDLYNTTKVYEINSLMLFNSFIDTLNQRIVLQNTIKKFGIISKENYENDEKYDEAVSKASYKIRIVTPTLDEGTTKNPHIILRLEGTDKDKLLDIIKYIKSENNKASIQNLKKEFRNKILTLKELDKLRKEDTQYQLQNSKDDYDLKIKKRSQQLDFQIEDINVDIDNSYDDYLFKNKKRLKYLKEQAAIARKLDIAKFSTIFKSLNPTNTIVGVNNDGPFYLKGFEAIEKEIEIIENREENKEYVVSEDLLKKKRTLIQDKTLVRKEINKLYLNEILILKKDLRDIDQNKLLYKRAEVLFNQTLDRFSGMLTSVDINPYATSFKSKSKTRLSRSLIIAIIFGGFLGLFYVIIEKKIKKNF